MKPELKFLPVFLFLFTGVVLNAQEITPASCYGGKRLMKEFIKEEMVYPAFELNNHIEGTVVLSFLVEPDGKVSDLNVHTSVSPALDEEAIRIMKHILWYPARELGKPIPYINHFEVKFDVRKYEKLCRNRGYDKITYAHTPIDTSWNIYPQIDVEISPKPVYNSSNYNFSSFVSNNLEYPEAAFKQNISGTVKLKFVVEPSGRISNILIEDAVGGGCTEEAIRVVKLIKWTPGILNGFAVRTWMCLEITFDIASRTVAGKIPTPGQVH
ncbi:MAG: energy transducer TonB [Bacteroidales bacterium]